MDDMKLMKELDFASFEEEFKLSQEPVRKRVDQNGGTTENVRFRDQFVSWGT